MNNFVKYVLDNGGSIKPLIIPSHFTSGTGTFNPSVLVNGDNIFVIIRHCDYTLYHSEYNKYEHHRGPLQYLHRENHWPIKTTNYFCHLNQDLDVTFCSPINTSLLDKDPLWSFAGLEDARIINWENKLYITGVRRDTDTKGTGRIELSQIIFENSEIKEISRHRIPSPNGDNSYCEKNWMPIATKPFHYVKWTNPTEIVKCKIDTNIESDVVYFKSFAGIDSTLKGGSQVIPYEEGHLCLTHTSDIHHSLAGKINNMYKHQFVYWDSNWNITKVSSFFNFMNSKIEFCCGMSKYKQDYLISFGIQDNASYILRVPEKLMGEFISEE